MKKYVAAMLLTVCLAMGAAYTPDGYTGYEAGPGYICADELGAGVEIAPLCDLPPKDNRPI